MLPTNLLPSGALGAMRNTTLQFMQQPITLYKPTITYNQYGQQVLASGTLTVVSGYIGGISGSDREIVNALSRTGAEFKSVATLLLPVGTTIDAQYQARVGNTLYNVIWDNTDTMQGVTVYCKAIVVSMVRADEAINYTTGDIPIPEPVYTALYPGMAVGPMGITYSVEYLG